jgi:hypothetical protein
MGPSGYGRTGMETIHFSSARTWERYTYSLTNYCNHIYKTPTQLIEEAEAEMGTPSRFKKYRAQVMAYREKLEDEGLSKILSK